MFLDRFAQFVKPEGRIVALCHSDTSVPEEFRRNVQAGHLGEMRPDRASETMDTHPFQLSNLSQLVPRFLEVEARLVPLTVPRDSERT